MKTISIVVLSIFILIFQDIENVREMYVDAAKTQKNTEDFYTRMSSYNKENQVLIAYKGAACTLKAKYAKEIKEKKSLFIEGAKLVDNSVKSDPNNVEIRLIRLSIQENSPKILNYKSHIDEDKRVLLDNYKLQNQSLKEFLKNYIIQSKVFSDKEKNSIEN